MRPEDQPSNELAPRASATPATGEVLDDTRAMPRVSGQSAVVTVQAPVEPELAGMLLPTEAVTFASSPHPVIFVRPLVRIVVIMIVLVTLLSWDLHPIVRGHHVTVPLLTGVARTAALVIAGLLVLREGFALAGRLVRYFGFRVVTTNRRVFVVEGLFGRRVTPLGNTALAGTTMWQGVFGRMFGYGTLVLPPSASWTGTIHEMRDPIRLYREFEAVAQGVDGDKWAQAIRQTQLP